MPRLSIVISPAGSVDALEETLLSVLENRPADAEVIVALDAPYADPYQLQGEVRFVETAKASQLDCILAGIDTAKADVINLLKAGCTIREGWTELAVRHFADRSVAAVAPAIYRFQRPEQPIASGVGYKAGGARYLVSPSGGDSTAHPVFGACAAAGFFRASLLRSVGGFDRAVGDNLADVDLAWRLRAAGFRTMHEPRSIVYMQPALLRSSEGAWERGLHAERLFWRNAPEVGWMKALAAHAVEVTVSVLRRPWNPAWVTELAARAVACCQVGEHIRHHDQMVKLRAANPRTILLQGPHFARQSAAREHLIRKAG
jgi:hypothetical protein